MFLFFVSQPAVAKNNKTELKNAIDNGVGFLQKLQRPDGSIADTVNPLFNTWETLVAAHALWEGDAHDYNFLKALEYLQKSENILGLICHNQKCRKGYCLETTAYYFSLLLKTGNADKVKARLPEILKLRHPNGFWEIGNPDVLEQRTFPSVTAWVLYLLNEIAVKPEIYLNSLHWLCTQQNQDGHWGKAWEYYNCPAYGIWVAMKAMSKINSPETKMVKTKALVYITKMQLANGSWYYKDTLLKQTSAELQTAFMLLAMQEVRAKKNTALNNGIDFLLQNQQKDGSWNGGYFPVPDKRYKKEEYVVATALAILVLDHEYKLIQRQ